jgi:hypothetical protein
MNFVKSLTLYDKYAYTKKSQVPGHHTSGPENKSTGAVWHAVPGLKKGHES